MKIVVTGGNGMMGQTIKDIVTNIDYKGDNTEKEFIFLSRKDCDLVNREEVLNYFIDKDYDYIIHLAAAVGGLYKNLNAENKMITLMINENGVGITLKMKLHRPWAVIAKQSPLSK